MNPIVSIGVHVLSTHTEENIAVATKYALPVPTLPKSSKAYENLVLAGGY
jgi:hypothetical protein